MKPTLGQPKTYGNVWSKTTFITTFFMLYSSSPAAFLFTSQLGRPRFWSSLKVLFPRTSLFLWLHTELLHTTSSVENWAQTVKFCFFLTQFCKFRDRQHCLQADNWSDGTPSFMILQPCCHVKSIPSSSLASSTVTSKATSPVWLSLSEAWSWLSSP